ncbi:MAG: hypothetical protein WCE79_10550 [Xanthobacteraceae bacterium]
MTVQNAKQIVAQVGENAFSIAMLQLCEISYYWDDINDSVNAMPPIRSGGGWSCEWGPDWDWLDTNLAFVACYYEPVDAPSPMFTCVVIRGTDIDELDPVGIAWQLWEDSDPENTVPLSWTESCPTAWIANGTNDGLTTVQSFQPDGGATLKDWLANTNAATGLGQLVVTGHSLGGCLTTVVAPWLQTALTEYDQAILPVTFAAPTAGNPDFAAYFNNLFSYKLLYQNPLDIAPLVYGNLPDVQYIYDLPCNVLISSEMADLLSKIQGWLGGLQYQQPSSDAPELDIRCYQTTSWLEEAFHQHHPPTYMSLLGGTNVGRLARIRSRRWKRPPLRVARPRLAR